MRQHKYCHWSLIKEQGVSKGKTMSLSSNDAEIHASETTYGHTPFTKVNSR
jgi:hypothetical protein